MKNIVNCIEKRLAWYKTAIEWAEGKTMRPTGFTFPSSSHGDYASESLWEWRGAERELQNTLDMMKSTMRAQA